MPKLEFKQFIDETVLDNINPKRFYTKKEAKKLLVMGFYPFEHRIKKHKIKTKRHIKWKHYKIFGSDLIRFLTKSGEYEIEKFDI